MTLQEKLKSLEGQVVTIRDHFITSVKTATGKLIVTPTGDPPGCAYVTVAHHLGSYVADWNTLISETPSGITIITGSRRSWNGI